MSNTGKYKFVPADELVLERLKIDSLWELGLKGTGVRVAILDTGIEPSKIQGNAPLVNHDFTDEDNPTDREPYHGTTVANCARLIAPDCEILNFKVIPYEGFPSKKQITNALKYVWENYQVDVINMSFDLKADKCDPKVEDKIDWDWRGTGAIYTYKDFIRESACELCGLCWDMAQDGIALVAAAGNRWGKRTQCPGRSFGTLCVEGTWSDVERDYFYKSKSPLRRWWDWKVTGKAGQNFGTSFAAGYTSGELALLHFWIKKLGWQEAKNRISDSYSGTLTTAEMMHDSLVYDSEQNRKVRNVLSGAIESQYLSSHLVAIEELRQVDKSHLSSETRFKSTSYLNALRKKMSSQSSIQQQAKDLFQVAGIDQAFNHWNISQ